MSASTSRRLHCSRCQTSFIWFLNIKLTLIDFKLIKLIKAATYHGPTELAGFHYFPESKKQQECNQFPLLFSVAATNSAARVREGKCEAETD